MSIWTKIQAVFAKEENISVALQSPDGKVLDRALVREIRSSYLRERKDNTPGRFDRWYENHSNTQRRVGAGAALEDLHAYALGHPEMSASDMLEELSQRAESLSNPSDETYRPSMISVAVLVDTLYRLTLDYHDLVENGAIHGSVALETAIENVAMRVFAAKGFPVLERNEHLKTLLSDRNGFSQVFSPDEVRYRNEETTAPVHYDPSGK